ncbi:DUF1080 domain-containing protein [bacterium]|nr:DUF1080 domain-containing protein [bacterium]
MKKSILCLCLLIFAVGPLAAAENDKNEPIEPKEPIELFNGKNLDHWSIFIPNKKTDPNDVFQVEDGVLKCSGSPAGYIRTKNAYKNYILTVEWRFIKTGNTGVLVHVTGKDRVWPKSLECQGRHQNQGVFYTIGGFKFANQNKKGRRKNKMGPHNEKPVGEWNEYKIVCEGDDVMPYVNGKLMNKALHCEIAAGDIAIQSEGAKWECRKIVLEPVKKNKK